MLRTLVVAAVTLVPTASLALAAPPRARPGDAAPAPTSVRVHAVRVADDDGSRQTAINPDQVAAWLAYADNVFRPAGIQFQFDPAADFSDARSTAINSIMPAPISRRDELRPTIQDMRDIVAAHPDNLVIFFRYGDKPTPTGNGFSSSDAGYVVACGFDTTTVCGHQNLGLLAHEIGHYFGLDHTFAREFATIADAEKFFTARNSDPSIFEGDGIADTPPDLFIREIQCADSASVTLAGVPIPIRRDNVMSYYEVPARVLTPGQIERVRWVLDHRRKARMNSTCNAPANPIEIESLTVLREDDLTFRTTQEMIGFGWYSWSASHQVFAKTDGTGSLTLRLDIPQTGRYRVVLYATHAPDYGLVQPLLDGARLGDPVDLYGPKVLASGPITLRTLHINAGPRELVFRVTGKNAKATGRNFGLDAIELIPE